MSDAAKVTAPYADSASRTSERRRRSLSARGRKTKGSNAEREVVRFLSDQLGGRIARTLAGATDDKGDVSGLPELVIQVKNYRDVARAVREGVLGVMSQKENADALWGCVFVRRPGGGFYVVMTPEDFVSMYREAVVWGEAAWR